MAAILVPLPSSVLLKLFSKPIYTHATQKLTKTFMMSKEITNHITNKPEAIRRPQVDFHPSIWDANLVTSSRSGMSDKKNETRIDEVKKEVMSLFSLTAPGHYEQLMLIENVERLGIRHHFEKEIKEALKYMFNHVSHEDGDLHEVSLRFRLLRQAGYYVSPGVFEKFKNGSDGEFLDSLALDIGGMLSLYEAAYLGCKGEDILDQAISFTTKLLKSKVNCLNNSLDSLVHRALDLPLRKRFPRVEARHYISVYEEDKLKNDHVLELAKLDYNLLQTLHKAELGEISRWWNDINIISKLPFKMRERLVEGYAIILMIYHGAKNSYGRIFLGKLFALLTVIDDTFDVYGTIEELEPFAEAILRWDVEQLDELPEYQRVTVIELVNLFNEVGEEMTRRGQAYCTSYIKNTMQEYVRNQLKEAKLFDTNQVPPLEDWLQIAIVTSGGPILAISAAIDMWEIATKENLDWVTANPEMLISCCRIGRYGDDIQTFKAEKKRGIIVSSISCYMKEHGVSEKEAIENIRLMVQEEWKQMNKDCLTCEQVPMQILEIILNIGRITEVIYLYDDGYTDSKGQTKEIVDWLLVHPVPYSEVQKLDMSSDM